MAKNKNLHSAKKEQNDEFYTQLTDIEKELRHYKHHFKDKVVFCNCDDPEWSNFWQYFKLQFENLGLKRLIATHYETDKQSYMQEIWKDECGIHIKKKSLRQNGDFRSLESIELLKQADVIVTNPPFSLFREYVAQLMEYEKKFIIIGNQNAITYKEIFPLLKDNKMWLGYKSGDMAFMVPPDSEPRATRFWIDENGQKWRSMGNIAWFTNLDHKKRHEELLLFQKYYENPSKYPKYDNYDAINVDKIADIPCDYEPCWYKCKYADKCSYALNEGNKDFTALCEYPISMSDISKNKCNGAMAAPITFVDKYNPKQFEILNANDLRTNENVPIKLHGLIKDKEAVISIKNFDTVIKEITAENLQQQRTCNSREPATAENLQQQRTCNSREPATAENLQQQRTCNSREQHMLEFASERRKCNGIMGAPITFLDKYNPEQFRIIGHEHDLCGDGGDGVVRGQFEIDGKGKYKRILIQKV